MWTCGRKEEVECRTHPVPHLKTQKFLRKTLANSLTVTSTAIPKQEIIQQLIDKFNRTKKTDLKTQELRDAHDSFHPAL